MKKVFLLRRNIDISWPLRKRITYYAYRILILSFAGFGMGALLLILALGPYATRYFTRFALPEYFTQWDLVLFNALPVMLFVLACYFVTGRAWAAFLFGGGFPLGLSIGNYFKLWFRDDPLYFEDILLLREAKNMVVDGDYRLFVDKLIIIVVFGLAVGTLLIYFVAPGVLSGWRKRVLYTIAVGLINISILPVYFNTTIYNRVGEYNYLNGANSTHKFIARGFIYPFIHSVIEYIGNPPEGYNPNKAKELLALYKDADIPKDEQVNIIAIMREAYVDLTRFEIEGLREDYCEPYHNLETESYTGDLLTNAAYGFTVFTERNFLTGDTYLKNYRGNTNSYAWYFRSQGYTVEGSHPYYQWFYNRKNINEYLGFENYRFWENDYEKLAEEHYPEDSVLFSEIYKDYLSNKTDKKPYFSFNVTMESHGPYDTDSYSGNKEYLTGEYSENCKNAVNNYVSIIAESDKELMKLVEKLRMDSEPVILVTFADHLPWMGNGGEFYEEMGVNIDVNTDEGFRTYYSTRYLIWANPVAKKLLGNDLVGEGIEISPCYLMNLTFQKIGWDGPAYMQAMNDMMEIFPVITTNGRYVVDGNLKDSIPIELQDAFQNCSCLQQYWQSEFMFDGIE